MLVVLCVVLLFGIIVTVPPEECFATFRSDDCGMEPKPVTYYYKPGSRCENGFWRGCLPNPNMFENEYECSNKCLFQYKNESIKGSSQMVNNYTDIMTPSNSEKYTTTTEDVTETVVEDFEEEKIKESENEEPYAENPSESEEPLPDPLTTEEQPPSSEKQRNYYKQQAILAPTTTIEPTTIKKEPYEWVNSTGATAIKLAERAVVAGNEAWDGSELWVIRSHRNGEHIIGKLPIKHKVGIILDGDRESSLYDFEVLCAEPGSVKWLPGKNGNVPKTAIIGGDTGEVLYIGRVTLPDGAVTPGKIQKSKKCCSISYDGKIHTKRDYEVLCTS